MTITYEYEDALYVNLTNKCNCNCEFCLRHGRKEGSIYTEDSLWLEREPTRQEALDDLLARDFSQRPWTAFSAGTCVLIGRSCSAAMESLPTASRTYSGWWTS